MIKPSNRNSWLYRTNTTRVSLITSIGDDRLCARIASFCDFVRGLRAFVNFCSKSFHGRKAYHISRDTAIDEGGRLCLCTVTVALVLRSTSLPGSACMSSIANTCSSSRMPIICLAFVMYLVGVYTRRESARTQLVCIADMSFYAVHICLVGLVGVRNCEDAVRISLASSLERISSSIESSACEISGLIEARVRDQNSVPFL